MATTPILTTPHAGSAARRNRPGAPEECPTWAMIAVAVIMVLVIAFSSGGTSKPKPASTAPAPRTRASSRIQEFKQRIEDGAQKLKAEQEQLAEAKKRLARAVSGEDAAPAASSPPEQNRPARPQTPQDQIEAERAKREYTSLFASNIALSYRQDRPRQPAADARGKGVPRPHRRHCRSAPGYAAAGAGGASSPGKPSAQPGAGRRGREPHQTEAQNNRYRAPEELRQSLRQPVPALRGHAPRDRPHTTALASYFSGPVKLQW